MVSMKQFNQVLDIDSKNNILTVEAGKLQLINIGKHADLKF